MNKKGIIIRIVISIICLVGVGIGSYSLAIKTFNEDIVNKNNHDNSVTENTSSTDKECEVCEVCKECESCDNLDTTQTRGTTEYQNFIKNLYTRSAGKTLYINMIEYDFTHIVQSTFYLGLDHKLYYSNSKTESEVYIPLESLEEHEDVGVGVSYGVYTGVDNVVDLYGGSWGNGGAEALFVLKTDGNLYFVSLKKGNNFKLTKIDKYSNIIYVYSTLSEGAWELHVEDINGNIEVMDSNIIYNLFD